MDKRNISMNELITDLRLLEILREHNFNQTASARFLANEFKREPSVNYEKFRYHIQKRIKLCEFIRKAYEQYKDEKDQNSFKKLHPLIKQQFCHEINKDVELQKLTPGTHTLIQLICCRCGEVISSKVKDLQRNLEKAKNKEVTGCPHCGKKTVKKTNSFGVCYPELAKCWDYMKNKGLTPFKVLSGSSKKIHFICEFGHSFDTQLYNVTNKRRPRWCPHCKLHGTSYLEIVLYWELQHIFEDLVIWNKLSKVGKKTYGAECDILLMHPIAGTICIELDSRYHRGKKSIERDQKKNAHLEAQGIKVLRLRHETLIKICDHDIFFNDNQDYKSITSNLCKALLKFSGFNKKEILKIHDSIEIAYLVNLEKIRNCHKFLLQGTYENKFLDVRPDLEKHWHKEKNHPYDPVFFSAGSHHPAYWKCPDCQSEAQVTIREMVKRKNPCVPCYEKNRKVAEYQDSISSQFPALLPFWDFEVNLKLGLDPSKINPWSEIEASWVCPFGHSYTASIKSISDTFKSGNSGCPACKYNQLLIDIDGTYVSAAGLVKKIRSESKENVIHLNSAISLVQKGFSALHCRAFAMLSREDKLAAALTTKKDPATELENYLRRSIIALLTEKIEPTLDRFEKAIRQCNGIVSKAEKSLGLRKSYISDYCRKRNIKIPK